MREWEYTFTGGSLYYEKQGKGAIITGYQGYAAEVEVPKTVDGLVVWAIGKKAFLSKKHLRRVKLPESVREIGDWAFAYCDSLREVYLPGGEVSFGRAVFLECGGLEKLSFAEAGEDLPVLLAAAVSSFRSYYLLDMGEAAAVQQQQGKGEPVHPWLEKWDARLLSALRAADGEGYSRQVLCGEEDYGSTDYEAYVSEKRKAKVRLAFLRLLHPIGLCVAVKKELEAYLREHTKGCAGQEAWQVVSAEHGRDREYYSLFAEIGCITQDNFQDIIGDISEEDAEMKAYFMRWKEEHLGSADFFDLLDF